jgi:hypothetical protein
MLSMALVFGLRIVQN